MLPQSARSEKLKFSSGENFREITSQLRKYAKIEEEECENFHFLQNYMKKKCKFAKEI